MDLTDQMKRLMTALGVLLVVVCGACLPMTPMAPAVEQPSIAVIGDSLTAGTNGNTDPGVPWWQHVGNFLDYSKVSVSALPGWTSTNARVAAKPAGDHDIVFIALGSNDQIARTDPYTYRNNLLHMADWGKQCFIISPWQRTGFAEATAPSGTIPLLQYNLHAKYVADVKGCGFVDWDNLSTEGLTYDGLHPTPAGNQWLANLVIGAMR